MKNIFKYKIQFLLLLILLILAAVFFVANKKGEKLVLENVDIAISNALVVTLDEQSHIYNPGYVVIKDAKIIALGQGSVPQKYLPAKQIDAKGRVVMPGLVNTHAHSAMSLLTGIGGGQDLQTWLSTMSVYESRLTAQDVYWGTLLAQSKMVKSGSTTFNDMYPFPDSTEKAVNDFGMRAVLRVPTISENDKIIFSAIDTGSAEGYLRTSFAVAPNPLLNYSVDQLKQFADYAQKNNLLVHIHFEEDTQARTDSVNKFNLSPLELLRLTGLIKAKIILAHSVDVTADEIKEISDHPNIGISFNPISEFKLHTPLTPVEKFLNANVLVGFGTDGEPSSNLSIFEQMKFAGGGYLSCVAGQKFCADGKTIDSEKILRMATIDGAKILGLGDKVGSLEVGKQADVIVVNIKDIANIKDIYQRLVYTVNDGNVTDSIIAGKLIMQNRRLLTINEWDILDRAEKINYALIHKLSE